MDDLRRGMRVAAVVVTAGLASGFGLGCIDRDQRGERAAARPGALVSDQVHGLGGTPGFFWLSPVVPDSPRTFTGRFEPRLAPKVRIDRIDPATGQTLSTVVMLTAEAADGARSAERVRRHPRRGFYLVRWQTARYGLETTARYRMRVLVGDGDSELGFADVIVAKTRADLRAVDRTRFVAVKDGEVFPIKFRIERKAVDRDGDGVFDWRDNCPTVANPGEAPLPDVTAARATPSGCDHEQSDCDPQELDCLPPAPPRQADSDADGIGDACECLNVTCTALDVCHDVGVCDRATGLCSAPPIPDQDGDGICDATDRCPADPLKVAAGVCGCGVPDRDGDSDGTADCVDGCPEDPAKIDVGRCGCGVADVDSDGDGAPDCSDGCAQDATKVAPGTCGCGIPDADRDGDGTLDCADLCPDDPGKAAPGRCGCGVSDSDTDLDGVLDCDPGEACPTDPNKTTPGQCGCGVSEVNGDGDGAPDCVDACPADAQKVAPLVCGCDVSDADSDGDGTPDCQDACPTDPTRVADPCGAGPASVDITWMSVSNVYYEIGSLYVLTDGYVTRLSTSNFFGGAQKLAFTYAPSVPDRAMVARVLDALGGPSKLNLLLTGHSHFDHAFDTATWSALTGAPIIGARTTCYQAFAQGIPVERCTEVVGGETIALAPGVTMRVIRWNHSGDSATNPEQHDPVELDAIPVPDPVTGGLRAGVAEDFPNGGGGRAFLFTIDGVNGPYSWFFQNSASASDLAVPIVVGGVDYGAPIENLKKALADAGLDSVDLWVGSGGGPIATLVLPVLKPKAYLPVHWDSFTASFLMGAPPYRDVALQSRLTAAGAKLVRPVQVMDKWRLSRAGVEAVPNAAVKGALGFK